MMAALFGTLMVASCTEMVLSRVLHLARRIMVGDGAKAAANRRQSDLNQRQTNNHHHDPGDQRRFCIWRAGLLRRWSPGSW
jgi:hypothetical protein